MNLDFVLVANIASFTVSMVITVAVTAVAVSSRGSTTCSRIVVVL